MTRTPVCRLPPRTCVIQNCQTEPAPPSGVEPTTEPVDPESFIWYSVGPAPEPTAKSLPSHCTDAECRLPAPLSETTVKLEPPAGSSKSSNAPPPPYASQNRFPLLS